MHGQFKPRNKSLNDALLSRKSGAHEDKHGKHMKRARIQQQTERELRREMYE